MSHKFELSVVVPGIRPENWMKLYTSLRDSIGPHAWEVIFVGPYFPPEEVTDNPNVKYLMDSGSPSRAFQMGSLLCEGELICFGTDDAIAQPNALHECIELCQADEDCETIIITSYVEGINVYGEQHKQHFSEASWHAGYHAGLRLPNVDPKWFIGLPLMNKDLYDELGGLDCRYEHINLNIYKMLFHAQVSGSRVSVSPNFVYHVDFDPSRDPNSDPILLAGAYDYELFKQDFHAPLEMGSPRPYDIHNWKQAPSIWKRRHQ